MSWAAPISSDTARMALPVLVRLTKMVKRIMSSTEMANVRTVIKLTRRLPITIGGMETMVGKGRAVGEKISCALFSRSKLTPMAVISAEMRA